MDSSSSTFYQPSRLRLSRMNYPSKFINEFSLPGPSIASSEFSDSHSDTHPNQHQQQTPRTHLSGGNGLEMEAATPADRLRAVMKRSRLQESASNSATTPRGHKPPLSTLGSEPDLNESDVEKVSLSMAAQPSMAQESLRDLFSRVKDTPPRKSPRRRNSIDASDLESPARSRMTSIAKGKQRSASDEEVEIWSRNLSMHEDEDEDDGHMSVSSATSRASIFNALKDRLDRSHGAASQLAPFAQSTPRKSYLQTPSASRIQFGTSHTNLLATDISMARAMGGMDTDVDSFNVAARPQPHANSSADEISNLLSAVEDSPQKPRESHITARPSRRRPSTPPEPQRHDSSMDEVSTHLLDESQHEADPIPTTTPRSQRSLSGSQPFHYESSVDEISEHLLSDAEGDEKYNEPSYAQTPKSEPPKKPRLSALLHRETDTDSRAPRNISPIGIGSQNQPSSKRSPTKDRLSLDRTPSPQTTTPQTQPRQFLAPYQSTSPPSTPSHTPPNPPRILPDELTTPKPSHSHSQAPIPSPSPTPLTVRPTRRNSPPPKPNQPTPGRGSISQELDVSFGEGMDITEESFLRQDQNESEENEEAARKQTTQESMSLTGVYDRSVESEDQSRRTIGDNNGGGEQSSRHSSRMNISELRNWHQGKLFGESETEGEGQFDWEEREEVDGSQPMSMSTSMSSLEGIPPPPSARQPFIGESIRGDMSNRTVSMSMSSAASVGSHSVHQRSRASHRSVVDNASELAPVEDSELIEETHLEQNGIAPSMMTSTASSTSLKSGTWQSAHRRSHTRGNSLLKELQKTQSEASGMSYQAPQSSQQVDDLEQDQGVEVDYNEEDEEEMRTPTIHIPDLESETEREDNHVRFPSTPSMADQQPPSTSTLKTPAFPGAFLATPYHPHARRRQVDRTPGLRSTVSMSTMKTPAPPGAYFATPRTNSMPSSSRQMESEKTWTALKTPRPPGGWANTPAASVKRSGRLGATVRFDDDSGDFLRRDDDAPESGGKGKMKMSVKWEEGLDGKEVSFDDAVTSTPPLARQTPTTTPNATPSRSRYVDAMGREIKEEQEVDEGFSEDEKMETEEEEDIWVPPRDRYDATNRLKSGLADLKNGFEEMNEESRYSSLSEEEIERLKHLRALSASLSQNREKLMIQLKEAKKQTAVAASLPSRRQFGASIIWKFSIFFIAWTIMTFLTAAMRSRMMFLTTYYDPFNPSLYDHIFRSSSGYPYSIPRTLSSVYNVLAAGYWHAALTELRIIVASGLDYVIDTVFNSSSAHDRALDLVLQWPPT